MMREDYEKRGMPVEVAINYSKWDKESSWYELIRKYEGRKDE